MEHWNNIEQKFAVIDSLAVKETRRGKSFNACYLWRYIRSNKRIAPAIFEKLIRFPALYLMKSMLQA